MDPERSGDRAAGDRGEGAVHPDELLDLDRHHQIGFMAVRFMCRRVQRLGKARIDDGAIETFRHELRSGLAGNLIESLLTDREGNLWVGTDVGLNRLRRKSLFTLSQSEGLGFGAAQGLAEVSPGVEYMWR